MLRRFAEAAWCGLADGPVSFARVIDAEPFKDAGKAAVQIAAATIESGPRERCGQEDNAEIGILPDGALRRLHGKPNARAD